LRDGKLILGAVASNLVSLSQGDTSDKMPASLRLGAAYKLFEPLTLCLDVASNKDLRIGTEYRFGIMALRAGYSPEGVSFGGGLTIRKALSLDLAVQNNSNLGVSETFSVGYRFGASKPSKPVALAGEYLNNGLAELAGHDYAAASRDIDLAVGLDANVGGRIWKRKAAKLHALIKAADLVNQTKDQEELREDSASGRLAYRAVSSFLDGDESTAMLLAHVAAGGSSPDSAFMRLLGALSSVTRQGIRREDILSPGAFVQACGKRAVDAIYARNFEVAVRVALEAVTVAPNDSVSWSRLGSAYYASGDRPKALEAYKRALEHNPQNEKLILFMKQNFPQQ
jgi:tetratricopeptide (TPR) repeat protein